MTGDNQNSGVGSGPMQTPIPADPGPKPTQELVKSIGDSALGAFRALVHIAPIHGVSDEELTAANTLFDDLCNLLKRWL